MRRRVVLLAGIGLLAALRPGDPATGRPLPLEGQLAFVRQERVVVLGAGGPRAVYEAAPGRRVSAPAWSPDGARLAFVLTLPPAPPTDGPAGADLMLVGADGSGPHAAVVHDRPGALVEEPAWGPDGRTLYYGYYLADYRGAQLASETLEVRATDLLTGATRIAAVGGSGPAVSPDGAWLAYVGQDRFVGDSLRLVRPGGADPRVLVPAGQFEAIHGPRFSPDGATIAFAGQRRSLAAAPPGALGPGWPLAPRAALAHGAGWEVWTVATGGGAARQLTRLAEDGPSLAWASDGRRLIVRGEVGLYLVDAATGAARPVAAEAGRGTIDWRSAG